MRLFGAKAAFFAGLATVCLLSDGLAADERKASPKFAGNELPEPPAQEKEWNVPETSLPQSYVDATKKLFDDGMADPRGGDYREIEIATGNVWNGDDGLTPTHGWVFGSDAAQRFAVCWKGLVYPVVSVKEPADWRADAAVMIKGAHRDLEGYARPEMEGVSWVFAMPVKGCFLLRLGDAKLAQEFWTAMQLAAYRSQVDFWEKTADKTRVPKPEFAFDAKDPYLAWKSDWVWMLFDRAVCAHMRGDDRLALLDARKLQKTSSFPAPLPALLKDQERRAALRDRKPALETIAGITQSERINLLIGDLDQVAIRQWGQPGGLDYPPNDPIVAALIREGRAAVEPLLKRWDADDAEVRLTRSVSFGRDFFRDRTLHPISMPIREALLAIMHATREAIGVSAIEIHELKLTPKDERDRFRAYWQRFGSVSDAERWYQTLADDAAGEKAWMDAAQQVVRKFKDDDPLPGEALRAKSSPSLAELLVKRAEGFVHDRTNWNNSMQGFHNSETTGFIQNSMKWEAAPMLPVARGLMQSIMDIYGANPNHGFPWQSDGWNVSALAIARASHGDGDALQEWADWIRKLPVDLDYYDGHEQLAQPFFRFPNHPAIRAAAAEMFARPAWREWVSPPAVPIGRPFEDVRILMLVLPEIRDFWQQALGNESVVGKATVLENLSLTYEITNRSSGGSGRYSALEGVPVGTSAILQCRDVAALELSQVKGFPSFSFVWPEDRKKEAFAAMKRLLAEKGAQLRVKPWPGSDQVGDMRLEIAE